MEEGTSSSVRRRELETLTLHKVGEVSAAIESAKRVEEVICALHSLALLLFPVDSPLLSGCLDERYRSQILGGRVPTDAERDVWKQAFYKGAAFPTMARILIYDVASNWLACFPFSARMQVYDSFFMNGPSTETVQALVPGLMWNGSNEDVSLNAVCSNVERLLVLCLLENEGVRNMTQEFGDLRRSEEYANELLKPNILMSTSRVAQLLASIPDKARMNAPAALTSHFFFRQIIGQLLVGAEERAIEIFNKTDASNEDIMDGTFSFVGETFSRICRRGSADGLLVVMVPKILQHVRSCLSSNIDCSVPDFIKLNPKFLFWSKIMGEIKDPYAVGRLSEDLLCHLASENISDEEAYWTLWMLFHQIKQQTATRVLFTDKFLLWKVFPISCLRWILQFFVLGFPPYAGAQTGHNTLAFLDVVQRAVVVWSKREFVQSAPIEQQAYVTATVGLCVERMSKEELETTKDVLHSILQGVSCRLESPIHVVRNMASSIALVFSKVVDPNNPLYLDDSCGETIDWEFGLVSQRKGTASSSRDREICIGDSKSSANKEITGSADDKKHVDANNKCANSDFIFSDVKLIDPDEIIDPAMLNYENFQDEDDDEIKISETSSDSSLQPYDLSDDDADLQRKFSQLADIVAALRKPDDADGVERALDVAERLVRASPDELRHNAGDLVKSLVQVRCSELTIEGEEESAEGKRHKALVALLVTCPFESLDVLTNLLYSPNLDVSQRILIIDVMTDAAQELADSKILRVKHQPMDLISTISESQPWFLPSSRGPPGAGSWKEVSERRSSLSWSHRYERELPSKPGQVKTGKSRRWSLGVPKIQGQQLEWSKNKFPLYAAAFMLPTMQGFDKRRHGVDLLDRDFIVLGKLIYMLGVCMKCMAMHPEASALTPPLLDMLSSREVSHHTEAYVRRSVLFTASCILVALHPSFVASALIEGNQEISKGLEWIRTWALHVAESDTDTECSSMAMTCLQLHAEMALQTSRSLESADRYRAKTGVVSSRMINEIIMPFSNMEY